ncbi:putative peptide zinc metalloprotease protein [Massilia sp. MP_M2]|uniref:HlyD family efflux transporter periplasmic adaptor subunit n=1 Tax=Massilia sp. MP_M2 TaxID=3071713 RepID=UPI00319DE280
MHTPPTSLAPLRPELQLKQVENAADPSRPWRLDDPVRQRSFLLADGDVELLALWPLGTPDALRSGWLRAFPGRTAQQFAAQFEGLCEFLRQHQLLTARTGAETKVLMDAAERSPGNHPGAWLRRWMGWQLPLLRPQAMLHRALPSVRVLWSRPAMVAWAAITLLGLYLVSRQWDTFINTFSDFSEPASWLTFGIALVGLKIVHELGHAFAATHHKVLVPTMGLSIAYGVPMLYTDTSDASRLPRRSARVWIGSAGMLAETLIAGPCTLAWALLPDGALRSTCFVIATSSWLTTLVVNLNPLGRFDGYYLLSDVLRYPNLQQRSLDHAGWLLERVVLGPVTPRPSDATGWVQAALCGFGAAVWLFRLFLGLAAARIGYDYLFQAAGVLLAGLTIWWTILGPLCRRMTLWSRVRDRLSARRWAGLGMGGALLALLVLAPLDRRVDAPATLGWRAEQLLAAPEVAVVEEVLMRPGLQVRKGQPLVRLRSIDLERKRAEALTQQVLARERIERIAGDERDRSELLVLEQQQAESQTLLDGIVEREKQLELRASADGTVVDLLSNLAPGRWVRSDQPLGRVLIGQGREALAYIDDAALLRVRAGTRATFFADDPGVAPVPLQVVAVESAAAEYVTPDALASVHGGPLATTLDKQGRPVPRASLHRVRLAMQGPETTTSDLRLLRGQVRIDADADSFGAHAARRLLSIILQELEG